ncbi:MAG: DUF402 domain-containing protein [Actinobacteria bacterium]|nr:DUF402 domain-containing protein [Actinomycetota bacterium]
MRGRWRPGDAIVLREIWEGRVWAARVLRVVQDDPGQRSFYGGAGWPWKGPASSGGRPIRLPEPGWRLEDRTWTGGRILSFAWPDVAHAVLAFWDAGSDAFTGWYVNLQDPLRPTPVGFDTMDHVLDVLVAPDGSSWSFKDEDEFEDWQRRGLIPGHRAPAIRAEGQRAARRIIEREPPFDRDWPSWRPDPSWEEPPAFPPGWDAVPPAPPA